LEEQAINEIYDAIKNNPDDIAVIIIETVQGEGGDNFFRKEFFEKLREIADENEILLMFDEVQCGFGITGKFWAAEHYVQPDIISFGKKSQICGIMVTDRIDDVEEHCFRKPSRINSTWGGEIVDMVRAKHILNIMNEENLVENARLTGDYLITRLYELQYEFPELISNVRGLGLMCSFDFPDEEIRKKFLNLAFENKLMILGNGSRSVRFRPALTIKAEELEEGLTIVKKVLTLLPSNN
jgi:L-lysine 6-transaminase